MLFNAGNNGTGPDLFFFGGSLFWNTWDATGNPFGLIPTTTTNGNWHNYARNSKKGQKRILISPHHKKKQFFVETPASQNKLLLIKMYKVCVESREVRILSSPNYAMSHHW
jgi:hypothetical protein